MSNMSFLLQLLTTAVVASAIWTLYSCYTLLRNYRSALELNVPIVVVPISHDNPIWIAFDRRVISLLKHVPFGPGTFTRYNWRAWDFFDKNRAHLELGDVFIMVSPGKNWMYVSEAEALTDIFKRRRDFPRPLELFEITNVFGPNISSLDGDQWQCHRKIAATCFNEDNSELVWTESIRQANGMLQHWSSQGSVRSLAKDTRTFSLNVLSKAAFGKSSSFKGYLDGDSPMSDADLADDWQHALRTILQNCCWLLALGRGILSRTWLLPGSLKTLSHATQVFQRYMTDLYDEETQSIARGERPKGAGNLMTSLIHASIPKQHQHDSMTSSKLLTESEVYGNIFVFSFAGHDSSAQTLAFAIVLLAAHPQVQDWLAEELDHVLGGVTDLQRLDYRETYPRLKRCQAVLLETLRLFPLVPIAKSTGPRGDGPSTLTVNGRRIVIPAGTMLIPNHMAVHTHPRYWGSDSLKWRPSRWILTASLDEKLSTYDPTTAPPTPANPQYLTQETLLKPQKGSFIPWSEGIRNCPGKKFSQVEFVAAMACLFREWRVEPVPETAGEARDPSLARGRFMELLERETGKVLLLQMMVPERFGLRWVRRGVEGG